MEEKTTEVPVSPVVVEKGSARRHTGEYQPVIIEKGSDRRQRQSGQNQAKEPEKEEVQWNTCTGCVTGTARAAKNLWNSFGEEFHEMMWYVGFLTIFCVVVFSPRNSNPYEIQSALEDHFLPYGSENFKEISSVSSAFNWLQTTLVPKLYPEEDFYTGALFNATSGPNGTALLNGTELANYRGMLRGTLRRVGAARLRMVRAGDAACKVMTPFQDQIPACYAPITLDGAEGTADFRGYTWSSEDETGASSWYSTNTKEIYGGAGYLITLPNNQTGARHAVAELYASRFVEPHTTRAVFVDFSVYNANVDMVAVIRLVVEIMASGAVHTMTDIRVIPMLRPYRVLAQDGATVSESGLFILEFVFFGLVGMYIVYEIFELREQGGRKYFSSFWNCYEVFNLSIFVIVFILKMCWIGYVWNIKDELRATTEYIDLVDISWFVKQVDNLYAFNAVFTFFKLFKFLRHNSELAQLTRTLGLAGKEMLAVLAIMCVVAIGYGTAFHLSFGRTAKMFRDFPEACFALLRFALGDLDLSGLLEGENADLGALLFLTFVVVMGFVLLSIFVAVVSGAYDRVRSSLRRHEDPLTSDLLRVASWPLEIIWFCYSSVKYIFTGVDLRAPGAAEDRRRASLAARQLAEHQAKLAEEQEKLDFYDSLGAKVRAMDQIQDHLKESIEGVLDRLDHAARLNKKQESFVFNDD